MRSSQPIKYGQGLLQVSKSNFAPRVGFAYQVNPKMVARGGYGLFYNSFENQGYGPNIGENYPFVYNFEYKQNGADSAVAPVSSGHRISRMRNGRPRRHRDIPVRLLLHVVYSSQRQRPGSGIAGVAI